MRAFVRQGSNLELPIQSASNYRSLTSQDFRIPAEFNNRSNYLELSLEALYLPCAPLDSVVAFMELAQAKAINTKGVELWPNGPGGGGSLTVRVTWYLPNSTFPQPPGAEGSGVLRRLLQDGDVAGLPAYRNVTTSYTLPIDSSGATVASAYLPAQPAFAAAAEPSAAAIAGSFSAATQP
ncbi:hypothetical protein GPECTOR_5g300 [Gonium pectorale]|uniref:Uncharacterized protein n=1 Tax=Gonium pectorale TaxID=33097 RepID=A0A150GX00_GONPE|nr:hypothetical protein GPECTOR_5g300 [Gonium pectorale]|eukprot:KXZ54208.1 hypothetical protein GPECTOR_5g300 [Gonium pectorale]